MAKISLKASQYTINSKSINLCGQPLRINLQKMLISFDQKEYQKLNDKSYQLEKRRLQIELLKLQEDVIKNNRRICIVFEGRDTAGKSSAFKFFAQYLIPKNFQYVNLGIPTKWESSHWFQRWKKVIPKKASIYKQRPVLLVLLKSYEKESYDRLKNEFSAA